MGERMEETKGSREQKSEAAALLSLGILSLEFDTNTKELNAVRRSIQDALDQGVANNGSDQVLQSKLQGLSALKQKYADAVKAFTVQFGLLAKTETVLEVNKTFKEAVDAYYNLKPEIESLIRKLRKVQGTVDVFIEDDTDDVSDHSHEGEAKEEEQEPSKESAGGEGENRQGKHHFKKSICIGLIVIFIFYSGLAAVINHVSDKRARDAAAGAES